MKILYCSSECVPFAASGGLGDVAGSLPQALVQQDCEVRVFLPLYKKTKEKYIDQLQFIDRFYVPLCWRNCYCGLFKTEKDGVTYYFIDNEDYFKRESFYGYFDDGERFAFFSKAILESLLHIDFAPDVINANDWQTALVTLYINAYYRSIPKFYNIKTIFTIHNIRYQGQYGLSTIDDVVGVPDEFKHFLEYNGDCNFMKAAIECSDKVSTVSPTYALEILNPWFAHGLAPLIRERQHKTWGILNGIDYVGYNPKTDTEIARNYHSGAFIKGKERCKKELIERFGLDNDGSPIISMVTRLVEHKGLDIVRDVAEGLVELGYEIVVLGSGDYQYEEFFRYLAGKFPGRVGVEIGFIPSLARKIYAGSDMFLMPSKSEPCGLSQMIALRYGTIPIVRETGGLKDSIKDSLDGIGNGFTFAGYTPHELREACERAFTGYQEKDGWRILIKRAMECDNSWTKSAAEYLRMYNEALTLW